MLGDVRTAYLFQCGNEDLFSVSLDKAGANIPRSSCTQGWLLPEAEIKLVHAWQPQLWGSGRQEDDRDAANKRLRDQEERQIRAVVDEMAAGRSLQLEVVEESAYSVLRNTIGAINAELLAMGTHSRSRLSTAIVGSLAQEFLAAAPCDVLVARA